MSGASLDGGLMNADIGDFKLLNNLEWSGLLLIAAVLIAARILASVAGWAITRAAERAVPWRDVATVMPAAIDGAGKRRTG